MREKFAKPQFSVVEKLDSRLLYGVELLKHTPDVDAILMDIMMPDIDG
jgi:CheY-like chemotaxis protein